MLKQTLLAAALLLGATMVVPSAVQARSHRDDYSHHYRHHRDRHYGYGRHERRHGFDRHREYRHDDRRY